MTTPTPTSPKRRETTITGLARRLGLSPTTVSFVLNGQAEERKIAPATVRRVLDAAAEVDYVPNGLARALRQKRTHAIGVVFPHLRGDWAHRLMDGIRGVLAGSRTVPLIVCHHGDPEEEVELLRSLLERRVDGILCNPLSGGSDRYRQVLERGTPLVFLGDCPGDLEDASYAGWDPAAVGVVVRRLLELGHRRIAYLGVRDDRRLALARLDVFRQTLLDAGVTPRPEHILLHEPGEPFDGPIGAMLAQAEPPTALFALYDDIAISALRFVRAAGLRCPQDVSIATIGNSPLVSAPGFEIMTVDAPVEEEGRACAQCLMQLVDNPKGGPARRLVAGGTFLEGRTAAPLSRP